MKIENRYFLTIGLALLTISLSSGCSTSHTRSTSEDETVDIVTSSLPQPEVILGEGDEIEIKFPFHNELNEKVTIRPDGKISLQMVDDIVAAGRTPEDLDAELTKRYAKEINNAELTVIVRKLASQRIFVGGEVSRPGAIPVNGRITAMEAILQAGGPRHETASVSKVVVIRNVGTKRYAAVLNLKPAFKGKPSVPFYLAANDMVFVPQSGISSLNQWVDQYINRLMPATYLRVQTKHGNTIYGYGR